MTQAKYRRHWGTLFGDRAAVSAEAPHGCAINTDVFIVDGPCLQLAASRALQRWKAGDHQATDAAAEWAVMEER